MEPKVDQKKSKLALIDYKIFLPALLVIVAISVLFAANEGAALEVLDPVFDSIVAIFS